MNKEEILGAFSLVNNHIVLSEEEVKDVQKAIKELQKELEEYKNPIRYFKYANKNVVDENKKLKDNWNKLKKLFYQKYYNGERIDTKDILDKMQELEQGCDNK